MKNDGHRESHSTRGIRALQIAACFLLVLWFAVTATVNAKSPPAVPNLAQTSTPTRTRTPTLTPTRSLTPRTQAPKLASAPSIPGQTQVDANAVALYHFDSPSGNLAIDATGQYTGTLYGNAVITTTGLYAGVLVLDGNGSYVRTGNLGNLSQGTIEAFVDFSPACSDPTITPPTLNTSIISAGGEYGGQPAVLELGASTGLYFRIYANGQWYSATAGINPCRYLAGTDQTVNFGLWGLPVLWPYETWRFHHIAGTWGPRGLEIWVDGVLHGVGNNDPNAGIYPYPYMCNPQDQVASALYPVCRTPVVVVPPAFPPGDYTGGLVSSSYSTFLIGCNSSALCFNGRIDEVRISNVQRTFAWTVDPTVTPTPTQTPVQITGAYANTDNTIGLYHLDSTALPCCYLYNQATMQYDGSVLRDYAVLAPGRFGSGVYLSGVLDEFSNRPHIELLPNIGAPSSGTVEAWINLTSLSWSPTIFDAIYATNVNSTEMVLGAGGSDGYLGFGINDPGGSGFQWAVAPVQISSLVGAWHHVAGTWGSRGLEIWIDGVLRATNTGYTGYPWPVTTWLAGCDGSTPPNGPNCMIGTIDEIRVSNVQRTYSPVILATPTCTPTPMPSVTSPVLSVTPSAYRLFLPLVRGMIC